MFWTNYVKLCYSVGKSPNEVAADVGVKSTGTVTGWKNGALPRPSILKNLSDYFSVSVNDLLSGEKEKPAPTNEDGLTASQKELIQLLPTLTDYEVSVLLATAKSLIDGRTLRDLK